MLEGIRVLEFGDGLVDLGGRMLAELGAEVISVAASAVERPHNRLLAWHHGKRRLFAGSGDQADLDRLVDGADIVLDDRRSRPWSERDHLTEGRPGLVHVIARPAHPETTGGHRPATDLTLMALSGLMTITGDPQHSPLRLPGEQAYALTGIQSATAALLALFARRRTGHGQRVEVSAVQAAVLANYREPIMYEWTGRVGRRVGNLLVRGKSGVRQVWPCADGYVTWSMIDNPSMMRSLVRVLIAAGVAGELAAVDWDTILVADTDQATIERWQAIVGAFFAARPKAELGALSLEHGWGLSVISDLDEVRAGPQLEARGLFVPVADEETGATVSLPGPLFLHSAAPGAPERVLPRPEPLSSFPGWGSR